MRLLLCCESYPPHRGGVQEVMRQIAERMVARGHDVTVATSSHPRRKSKVINGVKIRSFNAGGKMVYRLNGRIDEYREFVRTFNADALLIMAAQQWSFDALWPVLDDIKARKVFIPCGFSGLFEPDFAEYFKELPDILRKFDHLIFNAEKYRDIDFVRDIGLTNFTVLPNGISEADFDRAVDGQWRQKLSIPDDAFLFLSVGNPIEAKGHRQVVEAFSRLDVGGQPAVLLSIAGWSVNSPRSVSRIGLRLREVARLEGFHGLVQLAWRKLISSRLAADIRYVDSVIRRFLYIIRVEGRVGLKQLIHRKLKRLRARCAAIQQRAASAALAHERMAANTCARQSGLPAQPPIVAPPTVESIESIAAKASAQPLKRVILTDFERQDLVQAYFAADLFVFASRVEYSPLVLFEAAAAGTPFLTVPVGNADEIVCWTGGGILCEAAKDERGYMRVDPTTLAAAMARCMKDRGMLSHLGTTARQRWRDYFTWNVVAGYYEEILAGRIPNVRMTEMTTMPGQRAVSSVG